MGLTLFDRYTYLHFASGIVSFYWDLSLPQVFTFHTVFEVLENTRFGMQMINQLPFWPGGKPFRDSNMNIVGDTIGMLLGWLSAKSLK